MKKIQPDFWNTKKWLVDELASGLVQIHGIKRILHEATTEYQHMQVVETAMFGMSLVLDGKIQSGEKDEFIYHESLVHPAMIAHPNPQSVFIAGGGEGATLREVLLYDTVQKAVMVDIDREVVQLCKKYLPTFHRNSFDDPRSEVRYEDARKYIEETPERFDVALIDLADPVEEGPARFLYTQEFYQLVKNKLKPGGIMAVQSGQSGWINLKNFISTNGTLRSIFKYVCPYQVYVPSFVDMWGFHVVSDEVNVARFPAVEINKRIKARVSANLRMYDGVTHKGMFSLPKRLRSKISSIHRIITDQTPITVH